MKFGFNFYVATYLASCCLRKYIIFVILLQTAAVCEYPDLKDDVIVSGSGFTYASKGIRLKCVSILARQNRKNTKSKCLADSTWSVQNFTCSGKTVYFMQVHRFVLFINNTGPVKINHVSINYTKLSYIFVNILSCDCGILFL